MTVCVCSLDTQLAKNDDHRTHRLHVGRVKVCIYAHSDYSHETETHLKFAPYNYNTNCTFSYGTAFTSFKAAMGEMVV